MGSSTLHYIDSESDTNAQKPWATLIGIRVIIHDPSESDMVYQKGFYGKPFGVRKPGASKYGRPLELSLFEAAYLLEKNAINIRSPDGTVLKLQEFIKYAEKKINDFKLLYKVYRDLRDRGLIVRSGLKFGTDYSVYKKGPGLEHAPFLVHVFKHDDKIDPTDLVRAGRLSHSVRKKFVMAIVFGKETRYVSLEWFKP